MRSQKEERRLWKMLEECDAEQAKEEERMLKRERKKVQQARIKMKVGKNQPSMKDMLKVCQGMENGDCVSGITSRIGTVIDEVGGKSMKTFAVHLPQECPDTR